MEPVSIVQVDLDAEQHRRAVVELLEMYANDPIGLGAGLSAENRTQIASGLRACPTSALFLAFSEQQAIGLAVCFFGFSTFAAKPLLNIHDLIVHPSYRRQGVATQLLTHVEQHARNKCCCKVTLEVRRDNAAAQALYRKFDFGPGDTPHEFWTKRL